MCNYFFQHSFLARTLYINSKIINLKLKVMFKRNLNLGVSSTQFHSKVYCLFIELFSTPKVFYDTNRVIGLIISDSIMKSSLNTGLSKEVVVELATFTPSRS